MNLVKRLFSTAKSAGRKPGGPENSSNSYVIIDKCDRCPVFAYEDVVCNDNLRALVVEGNPPEEVLRMAKMELISEFSELSGNKQSGKLNTHIRLIYLYRSQIMGFTIAARGIEAGLREQSIEYLKSSGLAVKKDWSDEDIIKKIISKVKNIEVRLQEEFAKYEKALPKDQGERITSDYFTAQLIALSDDAGVHLTKDIMMSEFAIRIKNLQKKIDYVEHNPKH